MNAEALYLRAELMATSNRLAEALPNYEAAIAAMERVYGNRSLAVAKHRFSFATYLATGHQSTAAEREFRHAMQLFHDAGGQADLNAAIVKIYLGRMLAKMQDRHDLRAEGLRLLMQAREVFAGRAGDVSPVHAAQANLYLAEGLIDDGELEAARAPMAASMALLTDELESPRQRSAAQMIQARFLSECGDYDAAMGAFEAARTELLNVLDPAHSSTAGLSYWVGLVHLNRNELEKARAVFETILSAEDNGAAAWLTLKRLARMSLAMTQLEQGAVEVALPVLQDTFNHYHAKPRHGPISDVRSRGQPEPGPRPPSAWQCPQRIALASTQCRRHAGEPSQEPSSGLEPLLARAVLSGVGRLGASAAARRTSAPGFRCPTQRRHPLPPQPLAADRAARRHGEKRLKHPPP